MRFHHFVLLLSMPIIGAFNVTSRAAQPALDLGTIDRFIVEQMAAHHVPGLALAITRGDEVLYVQGYGIARDHQAVTPQTQFFIASVSKSFTALAVMQLAEAGRIDLDTPVQTYLPKFTLADPTMAAQITLRHLLNQVSGLSDAGFPEGRLPQPTTIEARVASLCKAHPVATPGSEFHYFNPNYGVLARVVEVVSGQPFSDYLQRHIFAPLHMSHTINVVTSSEAWQRADRLAQGHLVAFAIPFPYPEMSGYLGGRGGVVSIAGDMVHYLLMQNSGGRFARAQLLSPEGVALLHTLPPTIGSTYAMGWIATAENGTCIIEHNGILSTFYADIVLLPETGYGVVLLYNIYSLASAVLAFPRIKSGLIALLADGSPRTGGLSVGRWGMITGAVTLISVMFAIRRLLRLPRWREKARATAVWRLMPGIVWAFLPALGLLVLPSLITAASEASSPVKV